MLVMASSVFKQWLICVWAELYNYVGLLCSRLMHGDVGGWCDELHCLGGQEGRCRVSTSLIQCVLSCRGQEDADEINPQTMRVKL